MISRAEYMDRVSMPLEYKIKYSQIKIREAIDTFGPHRVYVSLSGLDSRILLDLVRDVDPSIPAIFMNTGQENATVVDHNRGIENCTFMQPDATYDQIVKQYGYPVLSKMNARKLYTLQHPTARNEATQRLYRTGYRQDGVFVRASMLPASYHHLINCGFNFSSHCCYFLKTKPLKKMAGMFPFVGTLAEDSEKRKLSYLKQGCNIFTGSTPQSRPLSIWTRQDIYEYAVARGLSYPACYGMIVKKCGAWCTTGETNTGCEGCLFGIREDPDRIERVKLWSPQRYQYYMVTLNYQRLIPLLLSDKDGQMPLRLVA